MERATRIAQALGLEQLLKDTQMQQMASTRQSMQDMLLELKKIGISEKVISEVSATALQFSDETALAWDPKEAARIYATGLVGTLSEDELIATERHYQTETGKKSYTALANSQARMTDYIVAKQTEAMKERTGALLAKVREAAIRSRNAATN